MEKYLDYTKKINEEELKKVGKELLDGKIVIFPTETVYAIGANGLNETSIDMLYTIKNRNKTNPINLLVSDFDMIKKITKEITPLEEKLIKHFFPGPLTIILKKKDIIPNNLTNNSEYVGIRMPDNIISRKLIEYAGVPLAAPSANISGKISTTTAGDLYDDFYDKVDYIIDGGKTLVGLESTIVRVIDDTIQILRPGTITIEDLKKITNNVILSSENLPSKNLKHYEINKKCILVYYSDNKKIIKKINELLKNYNNPLIICSDTNKNSFKHENIISYGNKSNLEEISSNLFHMLSKTNKEDFDAIIIEGFEEKNIGIALMNRLKNIADEKYIEV